MTLKLKPGLCWELGDSDKEPVPVLLFDLLREVDRQGSLASAARQCRVSYRNAWNLMKLWREKLGTPLIEPSQGRGAVLAECGSKLLWARDFANLESATTLRSVEQRVSMEMDTVFRKISARPLNIRASHCLSHQPLTNLLKEQYRLPVELRHGGSARCLQHLAAGDCTVAGFHLAEGDMAAGFIAHYRHVLPTVDCRLIHALRRRQGLIVKRGNPLKIASVRDLAGGGIRFVNRQANSGTRMLLDLMLQDEGVDAERILGYDNIEFTHSAVSALVAGDSVDVGLGLEAAAVAQDLDFIPLASEVYFYAVRKSDWHTPAIQALREALKSDDWRDIIGVMDGFDASGSGSVIDVEKLFSDRVQVIDRQAGQVPTG